MNSVLIIDDDKELCALMKKCVEQENLSAVVAHGGLEGLRLLEKNKDTCSLIILDVMMPDMNGFQVLQKIREKNNVPVLMLTAKSDEEDKVSGLRLGADDYLSKPYSMKELLCRVNALIRRTYGANRQEEQMTFGNVQVNFTARTVTKDGKNIPLSLREFDLLAYLCRHKNTAVRKDTLLSEVWGAFSMVEPSTLTVHMRWLREKLEDTPGTPKYLKTVWGVGYMLEEKGEDR